MRTCLPPLPFQSTPSVRRATVDPTTDGLGDSISIHALREEGDLKPLL